MNGNANGKARLQLRAAPFDAVPAADVLDEQRAPILFDVDVPSLTLGERHVNVRVMLVGWCRCERNLCHDVILTSPIEGASVVPVRPAPPFAHGCELTTVLIRLRTKKSMGTC